MALSVKRFIHALDCPEPSNQVNVNYHATSAEQLCNGNGTLSAIFSEAATLGGIIEGAEEAFAGEGGVCAEGMDVVFVVDYTESMDNAISGVKTGLNSLVSTINTQSNGNYRLGLVLFDGNSQSTSPDYAASGYYQALPSSQKINVANSNGPLGGNIFITCVEKMNTVGNSTSFGNALNAIDQPNSSTGMEIGSGIECGGQATYEVVANDFAGSFRSGVQKLIIIVTDDDPENTTTWFENTLTPALNNAGAQVMINSSQASDSRYSYIANNTQPVGDTNYSLNFNGTWTTGLETSIEELCESTFTYTCDGLAVGWYQEVGQYTAYYWDGSAWTSSHTCQYTVTINLVDDSSTTDITAIPSNHAYYSDSDTYVITANHGTTFNITNTLYAITDYTFSDITNISVSSPGINVFTDNGVGDSSTNALLSSNEFQITGTVTQDLTVNVGIRGAATQTQYSLVLNIIGDETDGSGYTAGDTLDANSQPQLPAGYVYVSPVVPASGWVDVGSTYYRSSRRYTFTGAVGSLHSFDVNLTPNPTDYDLTLESVTQTSSNTAAGNALSGNYTLSNANKDLTGTFGMPSGGGSVELFVYGQVDQPDYTYTLTATESITGASINGAPYSQSFSGYTGETFDFTIQLSADTDYSSFTINDPVTLAGNNTGAISYTVDNTNGKVTGTVTMPQGGGDGEIRITGSATQTQHTYTVTFVDPYTDSAAWQPITYTGVTGSSHETSTHPLSFKDVDTNYYITGVTNNDLTNLVSSDNGDSNQSLAIGLASMPQGGGSAVVTVTGSQAAKQYTFNTIFAFSPNSLPASNFTSTDSGANLSIPTTAAAGTTHTIQTYIETPTDHEWNGTPGVSENHGSLSSPTCSIQSGTGSTSALVSVTLTMPSGGGNGTVEIAPLVREKTYTYTLTVQTNAGTSSVNQYSEALASATSDVSGSNNGNGTVTITYGPMNAGDSVNDVLVGVVANNSTDYTPEITGFSYSTGLSASLTPAENNYGTGSEGITLDFTMHSQDPRGSGASSGTLTASVTLTAIDHIFTINFTDTISNAGPDNISQEFIGPVGYQPNWSQTYSPSSGYSLSITGVSDNSSSVSSVVTPGGQGVNGTLTMPSGGGSATVTASGTSTLIQYNFTVTWTNNVANANWNSTGNDTSSNTYTLAPGNSITISQTVDAISNYELTSLSASDNHNNITITSVDYETGLIMASVTMPINATGNQSGTITATGVSSLIVRNLTVNYIESITGAYIAREGDISSGSGNGLITQQVFSGQPGNTGTEWNALRAEEGYENPIVTGVTDDSAYISSGEGAGINNSEYADWKFDWEIPPSNQTATITVSGTATYDCTCEFLTVPVNPSSYGGSNGSISITVNESCTPQYSWTLNGNSVSPSSSGPQQYTITGLSAGTYTLVLTDGNGCQHTELIYLSNPATTTQSQSYVYYRAIGCDSGTMYNLRATSMFPGGSDVETNKFGEDSNMTILQVISGPIYQYSIIALGFGCEGGGPNP